MPNRSALRDTKGNIRLNQMLKYAAKQLKHVVSLRCPKLCPDPTRRDQHVLTKDRRARARIWALIIDLINILKPRKGCN